MHTKRLLQSKLEVSERRIQDLEKYEQLIEQCSPQQIRKMSLDECSSMKNKVKSLLFALEHEEVSFHQFTFLTILLYLSCSNVIS